MTGIAVLCQGLCGWFILLQQCVVGWEVGCGGLFDMFVYLFVSFNAYMTKNLQKYCFCVKFYLWTSIHLFVLCVSYTSRPGIVAICLATPLFKGYVYYSPIFEQSFCWGTGKMLIIHHSGPP